jgi:hypothetical protein
LLGAPAGPFPARAPAVVSPFGVRFCSEFRGDLLASLLIAKPF